MTRLALLLLLALTACGAHEAVFGDGGLDAPDRHHLTFDTGTDTATPAEAGTDAVLPTDGVVGDTAPDDALTPLDVIQADFWWFQEDASPTACDGPLDCGPSTTCGVCLGYWLEGSSGPGYCATDPTWLRYRHCVLGL